jgi:large subunit ribosomal protein L5
MTMCYQHIPPGFNKVNKGPRLRSWEGDSPYYKNRPLRPPRGGDVLRLLRKPITFRTIPQVNRVTVHSFVPGGSQHLHVAGLILQSITNKRIVAHQARESVASWKLVKGKFVSATVDIRGEDMYHFLSKLITVVLPRIKDWKGVKATTGDSSGNLTFGMEPEVVALFPEIEVNYDAWPPKMIPVCVLDSLTWMNC